MTVALIVVSMTVVEVTVVVRGVKSLVVVFIAAFPVFPRISHAFGAQMIVVIFVAFAVVFVVIFVTVAAITIEATRTCIAKVAAGAGALLTVVVVVVEVNTFCVARVGSLLCWDAIGTYRKHEK